MSGQLIRQSAIPSEVDSSFINKAKTLSVFVCFGFSACSSLPPTAQPDTFSRPVESVCQPTKKLASPASTRDLPASRQLASSVSPPRMASPTERPTTTASLVAASLGSPYQILKSDANSLAVCKSPRVPKIKSSLFEEAIVLAKIRSALKQEIPKTTLLNEVQFHDGVAEVAFRSDTTVKTITSAIIKILGISGVYRVNATLPSTPPTSLKN